MNELTTEQLEDFYQKAFISTVNRVSYLKDKDYLIEEDTITLMGKITKGLSLKLPKTEYTQFTAQKIFNRIHPVFNNLILTPFDEPEDDYVMSTIIPSLNETSSSDCDNEIAFHTENRQLYKSGL